MWKSFADIAKEHNIDPADLLRHVNQVHLKSTLAVETESATSTVLGTKQPMISLISYYTDKKIPYEVIHIPGSDGFKEDYIKDVIAKTPSEVQPKTVVEYYHIDAGTCGMIEEGKASDFRLGRKPNGELVLQGAFCWSDGLSGGIHWRDIPTVNIE